ncbi:conjugal transfer protein TraG, partial [Bacteroides cellulosilyticus]
MEREKKDLSFILILLSTLIGTAVLFQWAIVTGLYAPLRNPAMWERLMEKDTLFRFLYVILIGGLAFLFPVGKVKDENKKWVYTSMTLVSASILVIGFSRLSAWYNLFVFPTVFVAYTLLVIKTLPYFIRRHAQSDDSIFGLSREESAFYFRFETASGPLVIHKPQQNVYIDGGPGSGKSESWIKGIIYQCAERNYAGFVYDWEGDPTKDKSPILSRIAYGSIEYFRAKGVETPRFAYINFVDMSRTVRVNVLSPQYMSKGNESLFIRNIIMTLMKNLEASWKEKTDFWANNAINYVYSIAYKCFKERELGICTLPHVIALALSDSNLVFHWLSEDPEIALNMSSMLTAWKLGAQQQTAGAVSSAQTPLVLLNNKYIFWVLSPLPEEEFSLDITNKEHPTLLCVG